MLLTTGSELLHTLVLATAYVGGEPLLVVLGGALAGVARDKGVLVVEDRADRHGPGLEVADEVSGGEVPPDQGERAYVSRQIAYPIRDRREHPIIGSSLS